MQATSFYPACGFSSPLAVYRNLQQHREYQWHRVQIPHIPGHVTTFNNNNNNPGETCNYSGYSEIQHRHPQSAAAENFDPKDGKGCEAWKEFDSSETPQHFSNGQMWEKPEASDPEFKLEYMDLDEFLLDNNIDDEVVKRTLSEGPSFSSSGGSSQGSPSTFSQLPPFASSAFRPFPLESPGIHQGMSSPFCDSATGPELASSPLSSLCPESPTDNPESPYLLEDKSSDMTGSRSNMVQNSHSEHLDNELCSYNDGRDMRGKRSRARKKDLPLPGFSPNDLMLASMPGEIFDPRTRSFSEDELRPQPVLRKNRKQQYVPCEMKDDRYWARRRKNNVAAKRSRDARRTKENQIALRASFLEKENDTLRCELDEMRTVLETMKQRLSVYENTHRDTS